MKERFIPPQAWMRGPTRAELIQYAYESNLRTTVLYRFCQSLRNALQDDDASELRELLDHAESGKLSEYSPDDETRWK